MTRDNPSPLESGGHDNGQFAYQLVSRTLRARGGAVAEVWT